MSFAITLRQGPARLVCRLPQLTKPTMATAATASLARAFHQSSRKQAPSFLRATAPTSPTSIVARLVAKRGYQSGPRAGAGVGAATGAAAGDAGGAMRKLLVGGAIFGGTIVAINAVFNRETREDGGMPPFEREYLNRTFMHTGLGIGIIGLTARQMVRSGFVYRLMVTSPWVVGLGGLAISIGTMVATRAVDPDNYIPKYALWTAFNATQAAIVAPLLAFCPPALLARAGLYTVAMMGSLAFVGATAKQEKYLYLGGPLLAGLGVVLAAGFAPLVLPATAVRTLAVTEKLWLYGGLAVFGGVTLYDVQKILYHARLAEGGVVKRDTVNESISLELDFLNIFVRMVQVLAMSGNRK